MKTFLKLFKNPLVLLALIVLIGGILRFWNLSEYLYFNLDEERDLFIIRRILVDHRPTLIGGAVPGGIYLAPGYFYITAIFAWLVGMNPVGLGIVAAILGTLSIPLIYLAGKKLFDKNVGLIASFLYATSYLVVIYNKIYWPLIFAPIVTILVYFCLFKIVVSKKQKWFLGLFASLTLGIQSDPATFSLILLSIIILFLYKVSLKTKYFLWGIGFLIIAHLPLVVFDLRHDFLNLRAILKFFTGTQGGSGGIDPVRAFNGAPLLIENFSRLILTGKPHEVAQQISPCPVYFDLREANIIYPALFLSFAAIVYLIHKFITTHHFGLRILTLHLVIVVLGVLFYNLFFPGYTYEWFFYVFFPSFILIFSFFLADLKKYSSIILVGMIVSVVGVLNVHAIMNGTNQFGYKNKNDAVQWSINKVGDYDFSVDSIGACFDWGGYRYLFWYKNADPVTSYIDHLYGGWLYPKSWISDNHADTVVVFVDPDFYPPGGELNEKYQAYLYKYNKYREKLIDSKKFGRTEVLIVDNRDKWVDF